MYILLEKYSEPHEGDYSSAITASEDEEKIIKLKKMYEVRHATDMVKVKDIEERIYPLFLKENPDPFNNMDDTDESNEKVSEWLDKLDDLKKDLYYKNMEINQIKYLYWEIKIVNSVESLIVNFKD